MARDAKKAGDPTTQQLRCEFHKQIHRYARESELEWWQVLAALEMVKADIFHSARRK